MFSRTSFLVVNHTLLILFLFFGYSKGNSKAYLSLRVVKPICEFTKNYAETKRIQPIINEKFDPGNVDKNGCKSVTWSSCDSVSKDCQKFKLSHCTNNNNNNNNHNQIPAHTLPSNPQSGSTTDTRIIGGKDVRPNSYPYHVRIVDKRTRQTICGGSIIAPQFVLTSSSCTSKAIPQNLLILAGDHRLRYIDPNEQLRSVTSVFLRHSFNCFVNEEDIAIIKVDQPFTFNDFVKPASYSSSNSPATSSNNLKFAGWGILDRVCERNVLQEIGVKLINAQQCKATIEETHIKFNPESICIKYPLDTNYYGIDLGGAIVTPNDFRIVAIASSPSIGDNFMNLPAQLFDVSKATSFIQSVIANTNILPTVRSSNNFRQILGYPNYKEEGDKNYGENQLKTATATSSRVIGGYNAEDFEFPYNVRLVDEQTSQTFCGGAIISPFLIITAAHCLVNKKPEYITIIAGDIDAIATEPTEQIKSVKEFHIHECFTQAAGKFEANLAIVSVACPFVFGESVNAVEIPDEDYKSKISGDPILIGWGKVQGGCRPRILQKATVHIGENSICQKEFNYNLTERLICSDPIGESNAGPCEGDMGAPLAYMGKSSNTNENRIAILIGIAADGFKCSGRKKPSVFINILKFRPWILSHMGVYSTMKVPAKKTRHVRGDPLAQNLDEQKRKLGPHPSDSFDHKYLVRITHATSLFDICLGVLIGFDFVLTTSFCMLRMKPEDIVVVAGDYDKMLYEGYEQEEFVEAIFSHPGFDIITHDNDVALLKLKKKFLHSARTDIVPIAEEDFSDLMHDELIVTGWGRTIVGCYPDIKQAVTIKTISDSDCKNFWANFQKSVNTSMMCTVSIEESGANLGNCAASTGTPVILNIRGELKGYVLIGLASFGFDCVKTIPTVYSEIAHFSTWILETMDSNRGSN